MKSIIRLVPFVFLCSITVSCAKEMLPASESGARMVPASLVAVSETSSEAKAYISNWTDGTHLWSSEDHISVWASGTNCEFSNSVADATTAEFKGEIPEDASVECALYPYSASATAENFVITTTLPTVQNPDSHGTDPAALVSVARKGPDGSFRFKNAFGLLIITVPEGVTDVTSITVEGNNDEPLSGEVKAELDALGNAEISSTAKSAKYVTLAASEGALAPGTYALAVIPSEFANGLKFIVKHTGEVKSAARATSTSYSVARNNARNFSESVLSGLANSDFHCYFIYSKADLNAWNNDYENWAATDKVYLGADINYGQASWSKKNKEFKGVFDGRCHRIYNLRGTGVNQRAGFLHNVSGTVKNVCFGSADYDFSKGSAADAGTYDGYSKFYISGCAAASSWYYAAPISYLQANGVLDNVVNFCTIYSGVKEGSASNVLASYHRIGGIAGTMKANTTIRNCTNYGEVYNNGTIGAGTANDVGGIVSRSDGAGAVVKNCVNRGAVSSSSPYVFRVGGIIATAGYAMTLDNCQNYGDVTTSGDIANTLYLGGIIGGCSVQLTGRTNLRNEGVVKNTGNITKASQHIYIGGIIGHHITTGHSLPGAVNTGNILNSGNATGDIRMGGIMGYTSAASTFSNTVNTGNITNTGSAANLMMGGTLGYETSPDTVSSNNVCSISNSGEISGTACLGGIVGSSTAACTLSSSTCECSISNTSSNAATSGLVFGSIDAAPSVSLCGIRGYNKGTEVTAENWSSNLYGNVTDASKVVADSGASSCYYIGTPSSTTATIKVGTFNVYSPAARKSDGMVAGRMWVSAVEGIAQTIAGMDCDIIGFNELRDAVWNHPDLSEGQELKDRVDALTGNKYTWKWQYPNYADGRSTFCNGFAYDASKLQMLTEPVREWLSNTETTMSPVAIDAGRTIVYAKFRHIATGKIFWFASTHLTLGDDMGPSWYNAASCVSWAMEKVNHETTSFLVGDMNSASVSTRPSTIAKLMEYWDDAYASAKDNLVLDSANLSKPATRPGSSKVGTGTSTELSYLTQEKYRYDHIMFDKATVTGYNCVRDFYKGCDGVDYWPSDHFPIWATFEF